jgi:hypothetical protein
MRKIVTSLTITVTYIFVRSVPIHVLLNKYSFLNVKLRF